MKVKNVLIVEDEKDISDVIKSQLEVQGLSVYQVYDGDEAIAEIKNEKRAYDLFILDRMLPGATGVEICKFIRNFERTKSSPVLMVTALTEPADIVEGLNSGADDYITKPFDIAVLKARVNAMLRRTELLGAGEVSSTTQNRLEIGSIVVELESMKVLVSGNELSLTKSEFKLLRALFESSGKVLTRKSLVEIIQDGPVHVTERTIDTHIFGLRKKLGDEARHIESIRGVGYRVSS